MKIYICSVCGYDYDEAKGDSKSGIAPGTKWEDVPEDWVCPVCGADKSMFKAQGGEEAAKTPAPVSEAKPALVSSDGRFKRKAILASNLARGTQKQYKDQASKHLNALAEYFEARSDKEGDFSTIAEALSKDTKDLYPAAFETARAAGDRGALRALTWGEKVAGIQQNLLNRYQKDGDAILENTDIFVCEACGFIYLGNDAPEICPVCKVPKFKFTRIQRGA